MKPGNRESPLALTLRVLRDEGLQAVRNRSKDRAEEEKRLRKLERLTESDGQLSIDFEPPPVLNVSPLPPSPMRGGSQIQMLDRLAVEREQRTVALMYPRDESWRLEIWAGSRSGILQLDGTSRLIDSLAHGARLAGTRLVHVESLSGLPLGLVKGLSDRDLPTILSVHDFTLFCRKPHLIEATSGKFCEYSLDLGRCAECLRDVDPDRRTSQADYRRAGAEALAAASVIVYPSRFLHRRYRKLFPGLGASKKEIVISPASTRTGGSLTRTPAHDHVAFVGGAYPHKGGSLIPKTMELVRAENRNAVGLVYGNGDHALLQELRKAKKLRIRGYYRRGTLGELLAHDRIAVAVLPSIWPEAYGLVADECLGARVPVVAFDHGAVADRLSFWGVGQRVPSNLGALGLAESILDVLSTRPAVPDAIVSTIPDPARPARKHIELYRSLRPRKE